MSWIPRPVTPLQDLVGQSIHAPPYIAPPMKYAQEATILQHRGSIIKRWDRSGNESFPLISFNWMGNFPPSLPSCAMKYLDGAGVDCNIGNLWGIAQLGDRIDRL